MVDGEITRRQGWPLPTSMISPDDVEGSDVTAAGIYLEGDWSKACSRCESLTVKVVPDITSITRDIGRCIRLSVIGPAKFPAPDYLPRVLNSLSHSVLRGGELSGPQSVSACFSCRIFLQVNIENPQVCKRMRQLQ
jgi:hypothetical protein